MFAFALIGASERPRVTLMTALPLIWGEGTPADVLAGRSGRSETLTIIDKSFDIRAIDTISAKTLRREVAIIAQPRRLTPGELVALDKWVLGGGRAMIFADPELIWPSRYPPGDNRRAPPVELLDPLFAHWGIMLGDSDRVARTVVVDGMPVTLLASGKWTAPKTCTIIVPEILDCRIGSGRVILVGDADMLDARLWAQSNTANVMWIVERLERLERGDKIESNRQSNSGALADAVAIITVATVL